MTARPLAGHRVAVLRAAGGHDAVREALDRRGAVATTVEVTEPLDRPSDEVRRGVGDLGRFRWVAVTSRHAARRLALWADAWPEGTRVGAVGPGTAAIAEGVGVRVATVAGSGTARGLAAGLDAGPVLFLAAASARDDLPGDLAARGIEVVSVVAYDLVARALDDADVAAVLSSEALVAMSPAAIDALAGLPAAERDAAGRLALVAIGPTTAAHAASLGWPVCAIAASPDAAAACEAVAVALAR